MIYLFAIYVNPFLNAFFLIEQYINFSLLKKRYIFSLVFYPPIKMYYLNIFKIRIMLDEDSIATDKQDSKPAPVKLTNKKRKALQNIHENGWTNSGEL